jgi:hypothetical protein
MGPGRAPAVACIAVAALGVVGAVQFSYPTYGDVIQRLQALETQFPDWVEVWTGQVCVCVWTFPPCVILGAFVRGASQ